MTFSRVGIVALGAWLIAGGALAAEPPAAAPPVPAAAASLASTSVKPPRLVNGIWYLDQAWDEGTRRWYYGASQGSQIMPYSWFMALKEPETGKPFAIDGVLRHGFLPGNGDSPDNLPVGFVKDSDRDGDFMGMTCAACHTADLTLGDKVIRVDGAPTTADFFNFIEGINGALVGTLQNNDTFRSFGAQVLGPDATPQDYTQLYDTVKAFQAGWELYVNQSRSPAVWGPARLDAFGMIFNRTAGMDLNNPKNIAPPAAPVSYPQVWDAPWFDRVQWNGIAPNGSPDLALTRNSGEVLGVFGKLIVKKPRLLHYYYQSTLRRPNLTGLESTLAYLRSPAWPEALLGGIDYAKASAGQAIYAANCQGCHDIVPRSAPSQPVKVTMVPLFNFQKGYTIQTARAPLCKNGVPWAIKQGIITVTFRTEAKMAVDAACRRVDPGPAGGSTMPPVIGKAAGQTLAKGSAWGTDYLNNVVVGAIIGTYIGNEKGYTDTNAFESDDLSDPKNLYAHALAKNFAALFTQKYYNPLAYKARPLDGIWATAPYLHNGSVPNLYELMLPAPQRSKTFRIGTRFAFDPVNVGVDTSAPDATFVLDTSISGNGNSGHEFGAALTDVQRWQLIEYLKTL